MRYLKVLPVMLAGLMLAGCVYIASDGETEGRTMSTRTVNTAATQQTDTSEHMQRMQRHKRIHVASNASFAVTKVRLRNAITSRGLTIFNEIDHQAGAAEVGMELGPDTVFIFGNPKMGTVLMQANPAFGLDLPIRALVYETDDGVFVTAVNINHLMDHNHVEGLDQIREAAGETIRAIVAEATGTN